MVQLETGVKPHTPTCGLLPNSHILSDSHHEDSSVYNTKGSISNETQQFNMKSSEELHMTNSEPEQAKFTKH